MCVAAVIFSLIPILSGYAVYLVFSTVITKGSPEVQWTVGLLLAAVLVWALTWAANRIRRRAAARAVLERAIERVDVLEPHLPEGPAAPARDPAQAPQATGH